MFMGVRLLCLGEPPQAWRANVVSDMPARPPTAGEHGPTTPTSRIAQRPLPAHVRLREGAGPPRRDGGSDRDERRPACECLAVRREKGPVIPGHAQDPR